MANQEGNSGSVVGIRGEFELTYPMPSVDAEVGGGPRDKTKWWHRSTHQNKTKWWHRSTHRNKTKWWQYRNLQRDKTVAWLRNRKQVPLQHRYEAVAWDTVYSKLGPPLVGGVPNSSDTIQILLDCKENGQNLSNQLPPSIYMIPSSLRDLSPSSFEPQVVSIGPLHSKDEMVQEFEAQKATYLHHLLDRFDFPPRQILDACLQRVNASIHKIRACYGGMKTYTDEVELAKMMVMDACFILEFLFPTEEHEVLISRNVILEQSIFHDLVLLENQIPFFVLQDIFDCTLSKLPTWPSLCLASEVLKRLQFLNPFKVSGNDVVGTTPHHILGLLQTYFHPAQNIPTTCPTFPMSNHYATELDKAGVRFKPNNNGNWPMAIDFSSSRLECFRWWWGNRTLRMPALCIDDNTELFLRNIIAYEQCTPDVPDYVTSYACAIDMLVDTKEDLSKLVESKVLSNDLGSNQEATNMLNRISKQVVFAEFYYMEQWKQLDMYYNGYWPKNVARLKRIYFSSPWNIIALLAGIVLFALTILQTILRIKK
ncbi:putative UPF0481 protein At3g02645 [Cynara cardunculus var. scolymus]|uniref:putative UPF0481 protein At3g02645 n=1 Tax=Cynara cardunculus var. scolymus TaxID=59895 RepID=UPI000D62E394|nr:putative UPF0481 protein At3g02645 [Cynara cardunculus var. scolymus]